MLFIFGTAILCTTHFVAQVIIQTLLNIYSGFLWLYSIHSTMDEDTLKVHIYSMPVANVVSAFAMVIMLYVVHRVETELFVINYITNKEKAQLKSIMNLLPDAVFITFDKEMDCSEHNSSTASIRQSLSIREQIRVSKVTMFMNDQAKAISSWAS